MEKQKIFRIFTNVNKEKKSGMTLEELREQIQEDLLCLTDEYLIDELDGYEDFEDKMCQIVVDNFKKLEVWVHLEV